MFILQETQYLIQYILAENVGVMIYSLNYYLKVLTENGLVSAKNFAKYKKIFYYVFFLVISLSEMSNKAVNTYKFLQIRVNDYDVFRAKNEALTAESGKDMANYIRKHFK
jgi:hypothetical protein